MYTEQLRIIFEGEKPYKIERSQEDGWKISTPFGFIDYRHVEENDTNEIWWVESKKKGHGSELVDFMQAEHPATSIAWGLVSPSGAGLARKWHRNHPEIDYIEGRLEGQAPGMFGDDEDDVDGFE